MRRPIVRLLIIAVLLAGSGLVLWLATIDAPRAGEGQPDRSWVAGYLHDDHRFGQFASLALNGLTGVRLWLPRPVSPGDGLLLLHVRPAGGGADRATAQIALSALAAHGPTDFRFAPVRVDPLLGEQPVSLVLMLET